MLRLLLAVLIALVTLPIVGSITEATNHLCTNYPSQAAAQAAYRADPIGHRSMDADSDGIACETRPAPRDLVPVQLAGNVTQTPVPPTPRPAATATPVPAQPTATPVPVQPTSAPAPAQPTATPGIRAAPEIIPDGWATVARVIDGDTVDVQLESGQVERLRLIGLDTPETVDPRRPVQCYGQEASDTAKAWLPVGTWVLLESDPVAGERDRFGRLLRYIWVDGTWNFAGEMIRAGYATELSYQGQLYRYRDDFRAAQAEAMANNAGLWAPETCAGVR